MGGLLHLVQRGGTWAGCGPAQSLPRCTKCNSQPINGQCTNFILFDVALQLPVPIKELIVAVHGMCSTDQMICIPRRPMHATSGRRLSTSSVTDAHQSRRRLVSLQWPAPQRHYVRSWINDSNCN